MSEELTIKRKITFLKYCIRKLNNKEFVRNEKDRYGVGLCFLYKWYFKIKVYDINETLFKMKKGFPELFAIINKCQRRRNHHYAWSSDVYRLKVVKKLLNKMETNNVTS